MSLNRRSIMKLIGAAPMAAPMAASAAAAGLAPSAGAFAGQYGANQAGIYAGSSPATLDGSFWRDRLKELSEKRGERRAAYLRRVSKLDPDLSESRSLSLGTKIRLQAERDEQRDFDEESGRYLSEIARFAKQSVGL